MNNSNIKINEDKQYQDVYATYTINIVPDVLKNSLFIKLEDEDDDLGDYKISHILVNSIPVFIQKYNCHNTNEFSIFVDHIKCAENNEDIFNISEQLITALKLDKSNIVWKNEKLQDLMNSSKV